MRVVYYTDPCYLDQVLSEIRWLARKVELYLILQIAPESQHSNLLNGLPKDLPNGIAGIIKADHFFQDYFPKGVYQYCKDLKGFFLAIHKCPKSIHTRTWQIAWKTAYFIRKLNPDIIHFNDVSLRLCAGIPLLRRFPIILSVHDPFPHSGEEDWRTHLARIIAFRYTRRFIVHNRYQLDSFCTYYKLATKRVKYIPLGMYDVYRHWGQDILSPPEVPTVLFLGRFSYYKGLDVFIKAASAIAKDIPNVRFVLAGRPVNGFRMPALPLLSNGCSFVTFTEHISNTHLAELFQHADLVVLPYRDATQSGVLLTAYAFGKPVVVTRVGGLPEYVLEGKTGLVVSPGVVDELSDAVISLFRNPSEIQRLSCNVRNLTNTEFSWDSIVSQIVQTYEVVVTETNF